MDFELIMTQSVLPALVSAGQWISAFVLAHATTIEVFFLVWTVLSILVVVALTCTNHWQPIFGRVSSLNDNHNCILIEENQSGSANPNTIAFVFGGNATPWTKEGPATQQGRKFKDGILWIYNALQRQCWQRLTIKRAQKIYGVIPDGFGGTARRCFTSLTSAARNRAFTAVKTEIDAQLKMARGGGGIGTINSKPLTIQLVFFSWGFTSFIGVQPLLDDYPEVYFEILVVNPLNDLSSVLTSRLDGKGWLQMLTLPLQAMLRIVTWPLNFVNNSRMMSSLKKIEHNKHVTVHWFSNKGDVLLHPEYHHKPLRKSLEDMLGLDNTFYLWRGKGDHDILEQSYVLVRSILPASEEIQPPVATTPWGSPQTPGYIP